MSSSKHACVTTVLMLGEMFTLSCPQGVLRGVLVSQLFIMPGVRELCLPGSLGFCHWYSSAREEGAVSQEGGKLGLCFPLSSRQPLLCIPNSVQAAPWLILSATDCFMPGAGSGICHCCDIATQAL